MISDQVVLEEIKQGWQGAEVLRKKTTASLFGGDFTIFIADQAHNLPFIHACSVLNDVLLQLKEEGHFSCRKFFLGALLNASKDKLTWQNFTLLKECVEKRNEVAHKGQIIPRGDCWKYMDAIREQLIVWGILEST